MSKVSRRQTDQGAISSHVSARIGRAVDELIQSSVSTRGLSAQIEQLCELNVDAEVDDIRQTAIGARAASTQLALISHTLVGVSERLESYAAMRECLQDDIGDDVDDGG